MSEQMRRVEFELIGVGHNLTIEMDREVLVGRDPSCDVVLAQGQPSRKHARLSPLEDGVMVEDLGSTNGTFVNGERITGKVKAVAGDSIRFDTVSFKIKGPELELGTVMQPASIPPMAATVMHAPEPTSSPTMDVTPKSWAFGDDSAADGTQLLSKSALSIELPVVATTLPDHPGPCLIGVGDGIQGRIVPLQVDSEHKQWEIGRDASAQILIDDDSVSGEHAQLIYERQRWKLVNVMSANGTFVNGERILTSYLNSGDHVRFGRMEYVFRSGQPTTPKVPTEEKAIAGSTGTKEPAGSKGMAIVIGVAAFAITLGLFWFIVLS